MDLSGRVERVVSEATASGDVVGTVVMVAKDGEIVHAQAAGFADREAGRPVQLDSIFRYASLTKPLTAATALAMMDRGLLGLDDAVADHLPWFRPRLRDGREPTITIRHLLTHTSGLDYSDLWVNTGLTNSDRTLEENYGLVAKQPLNFEPGTAWLYGCSTDVLGAVVAQRHGGTLGDALAHYVTGPLGMSDTGHAVTDAERLVVPYADGPPGLRRMSDPDTISYEDGHQLIFSPGRIFNPKAFHSGGGGAVGTAKDFLTFLETVRMGGQPILRRETLAEAVQNQIGDLPRDRPGQRFGFLGAVVDDPAAADRPVAKGTVRWGGVYGNDWLVDFENRLSVVVLTNTPIAGCDGPFSQAVVRAVYG